MPLPGRTEAKLIIEAETPASTSKLSSQAVKSLKRVLFSFGSSSAVRGVSKPNKD